MVAIRLRHPQGVATIDIPQNSADFSVKNLLDEIYAVTNILPANQILKAGYPPKTLTAIPELPITSLGLSSGDQIIVNQTTESVVSTAREKLPAPASNPIATTSTSATSSSNNHNFIRTEGGFLVHRVVPDDNSCLFSAVAVIFEQDIAKANDMRQIVAVGLRNDPTTYNEAVLGMPPSQYITTILKPSTWGGAIELGILASHYNTEIDSIDVESGRIDLFSPSAEKVHKATTRCVLLYSGIHYDAITLAPTVDSPHEWHQTIFPANLPNESDPILVAAAKLADNLRQKKAFTNTATFQLKCEVCGQALKGEKDARAHAANTGHSRFGEY